jgi:hypothetical protein
MSEDKDPMGSVWVTEKLERCSGEALGEGNGKGISGVMEMWKED